MELDRRKFVIGAGAGVAVMSLGTLPAFAATEKTAEEHVKEFTGGAATAEGKIDLSTPEIAENGNTVPIGVEIDSAMEGDDMVESVMILADGNPNPEVVIFNFSPLSGVAAAKTRVRLAKTQNIIAVAKMKDGSFQMAKNEVKVTIGGCGG